MTEYKNGAEAKAAGVKLGEVPQMPSTWHEQYAALKDENAAIADLVTDEKIDKARRDLNTRALVDQKFNARLETAARVLETWGDGHRGGYPRNEVLTVLAVLALIDGEDTSIT